MKRFFIFILVFAVIFTSCVIPIYASEPEIISGDFLAEEGTACNDRMPPIQSEFIRQETDASPMAIVRSIWKYDQSSTTIVDYAFFIGSVVGFSELPSGSENVEITYEFSLRIQ